MKDIVIVCAGSTAQEVFTTIEHINRDSIKDCGEKKYNILGFIDDNKDIKLPDYINVPIIGGIGNWTPLGNEVYAMGNSSPKAKEKIASILKTRGCKFESIIPPYAGVQPYAKIGEGCYITSFAVGNGSVIGDFVNIQGSLIGGHAVIGDYSTTLGFANVPGANIGKRVYVGSHAVILGSAVGDDAVICAGSIVFNKVKAGSKVFGNPAKRIDW